LASLLPEAAHRGGHATEPRRSADNDRVIVAKFGRRCDRGLLIELEVEGLGDFFGNILRHAFHIDRRAGRARAFGLRIRHLFYVAETGIVKDGIHASGQ
jgi:hypothetical protein